MANYYPHLVLRNPPQLEAFRGIYPPIQKKSIPLQDPKVHGALLQKKLQQAWEEAQKDEQVVAHVARAGVYLEFKSFPDVNLVTKSLEDMASKQVRLLNVREETEAIQGETGEIQEQVVIYATVFVAKDKIQFFTKKFDMYVNEVTNSGLPRNADLVNSIADICRAILVESFWQDAKALIPLEKPEWCEVWLRNDDGNAIQRFEQLLERQRINARPGFIRFPERVVKLIQVNRTQLEQLVRISDDIAEYRRAKETATFWIESENRHQAEWVQSLLERIQINNLAEVSVCILDAGINEKHPLIAPTLAESDCHSVDIDWGIHDHHKWGHGTLMAGVAIYGDLMKCLSSNGTVELRHCLESVKILPPPPKENEPELWGELTSQGISRAEIKAPDRKRIICMAVAAADTRDFGRPSSWSAELDQLASGATDDVRRLLLVSAGNVDPSLVKDYPSSQCNDSVHDPGQSWNALTIGAYTNLDTITDQKLDGYEPLAPKGGLSPFSTTSLNWEDKWPIKPEILLEGGNVAQDSTGFTTECDDLSVLSTFRDPQVSHFYPFNMTSSATAQAAWFAAQIQAQYPDLWPETIRALMVHSAKWPETLLSQFRANDSKTAMKKLMRICGYGVPNLERALYSAANSLTLISQAEIQPFDRKEDSSGYRTKDMHLYSLPWPKEVLLSLPPTTDVSMQITLSYFIEPGPGEIGWKDRYRYASHGLRFDINSPNELRQEFIRRINAAARSEEEGHPGTDSASDHWLIGSQTRNKGSIHSDIWRGTAAELATSNLIAVSPRVGWWRERHHLGKWNRQTRYALVVSITTPEESIDLYTPVAVEIGVATPVPITI
jgi:hypothetical protein